MKTSLVKLMYLFMAACLCSGCGAGAPAGNRASGNANSVDQVLQSGIEGNKNDGKATGQTEGDPAGAKGQEEGAADGTAGTGIQEEGTADGMAGTGIQEEGTADGAAGTGIQEEGTADGAAGTGDGGETTASGTEKVASGSSKGIDVDLTKMSATMVYSEVFEMMSAPQDYVGKTIKMKGNTMISHDETDGNDYYSCVIKDAAACCAQGIEFQLKGGKHYPEEGREVTVVGRFETYKIGKYEYCTLKDAVLK